MVELSTFIGQLISDVASARTNADIFAASTSELYHADPFVKNLPIPHYIIDSAEIDVPVMVVGITKNSDQFENQKQQLFALINNKLPVQVIRSYKYAYFKKHEKEIEEEERKHSSKEKLRVETGGSEQTKNSDFKSINVNFTEEQLTEYAASAKTVTDKVVEGIRSYLESYTYDLVKILDLSDEFIRVLKHAVTADAATYKPVNCPFADKDAVIDLTKYIGNIMFFEFKKIMRSGAAVQVDLNTVQMNEYATKDCLMHIKLKVKEQDLSLMVEEGENGRDKRYLSLS